MKKYILILATLSVSLLFISLYAQTRHSMHQTFINSRALNDSTLVSQNNYPYGPMMHGHQGMMHGNMMGMMDGNNMMMGMNTGSMNYMNYQVLSRVYSVLYQLPNMQKELDLNVGQQSQLNELRSEFDKTRIDRQADIAKIKIDLNGLIKGNADGSQIRKSLSKINAIKTEIEVNAYETSQKMLAVLMNEQLSKWNENESQSFGHKGHGGMMHN